MQQEEIRIVVFKYFHVTKVPFRDIITLEKVPFRDSRTILKVPFRDSFLRKDGNYGDSKKDLSKDAGVEAPGRWKQCAVCRGS